MPRPAVFLATLLIRGYRAVLSPWMGQSCRFSPTCSHYAEEALARHGFWKGLLLGSFRILRCHPFYRGAWLDPVPERFAWRNLFQYNGARTTLHEDKQKE